MNPKYEMYVEVFQDFVIHYQNQSIHMNDYLSKQTLDLFEVLILHHGKTVSKERLIDIFWEHNNNPDSALKFNIYHLRKLLKSIPLLSSLDIIKTEKNGYRFQPDVTWDSDCKQFEELYNSLALTKKYVLSDYRKMTKLVILYKGKLYYNHSATWFLQKEEQYRSNFLRYVTPLCELCLSDSRYEDVKALASKTILLEPSSENIHYYQILTYVKEGNYAMAYDYYQKAVDVLVNEYELELSQRMKDLYEVIINNKDQKYKPKQIMMEYQNKTFKNGALFCTMDIFDCIFEQRLRESKRMQTNYYLYVFEVEAKDLNKLEDQMEKLKTTITKSLRSGDVFTKLNNSQYMVLLFCTSRESAFDIAQRVSKNFRTKVKKSDGTIHYYLQKIND